MKIVLVSKCSLDIEQYVEFKMSVLASPSKSLINSRWVTYVDTFFSRIKNQLSTERADFCHVKMCVLVTWIGCIFYITNFLWPDTLYFVLIFEMLLILWFCFYYCFVDLHLVFQLSCFIGKFVYFVSLILLSLFLVHSSAYYLSQCTFLLFM